METIDDEPSELDIQTAMVELVRQFPDKTTRPDHVRWGGIRVKTIENWHVPKTGTVTIQFVSSKSPVRQGFDIKSDTGGLLVAGSYVNHLRTWRDLNFEDAVSYHYDCLDGTLKFWNVYERQWPNGETTEEHWTGNSGFYVNEVNDLEKVFHCSHGAAAPPDFECLVVRVTISES